MPIMAIHSFHELEIKMVTLDHFNDTWVNFFKLLPQFWTLLFKELQNLVKTSFLKNILQDPGTRPENIR